MKLFFNTLTSDMRRMIFSFKFVAAVVGLSAVMIITLLDELSLDISNTTVTYARMLITYLDFDIIYLLFAAIPSATVFCIDWENRYFRFSVMRLTKRKYATSKAIACFASAFLVVAFSEWLNILLFSFFFPVFNVDRPIAYGIYDVFNTPTLIYVQFAVEILFKSLCAGFCCVFSLWISTYITNIFVTLASPLLLYYIINMFSNALLVPSNFSIHKLSNAQVNINDSPALSILYTIGIFLIAAAVLSILFVHRCRRRIENG